MMDKNNKEAADVLIECIMSKPDISEDCRIYATVAISITKTFCHELADIARAIRGIPDPVPNEEDYGKTNGEE